jgi:hypothetical protein
MGDAPCFDKKRPGEACLAALRIKKAAGLSTGGLLLNKIYLSAELRQTGSIIIKPIIKKSVRKMICH